MRFIVLSQVSKQVSKQASKQVSKQVSKNVPGKIGIVLLFSALLGVATAASAAGVPAYKVEQIAVPGATFTYVNALNTKGAVVGNFVNSSDVTQGFEFSGGKYKTIADPHANNFTRANAINDSGLVAGDFLGSDGFYHGFTLSGSKYKQFDVAKKTSTSIFGLDNNGDFAGAAGAGGPNQGFVDIGGTVTEFYGSGTDNTFAYAINDSDEAVGQYIDSSNLSHGYMRDSTGVITEIVPPGAVQTACLGLNDAGVITGWYINSAGQSYGFTDTAGVFVTVDFLEVNDINSSGVFVGVYVGPGSTGATEYGYLATPATFKNFGTVAVPKAMSTSIYGVNNSGSLTGFYETSSSAFHGLLMIGNKITNLDDPSALTGTTVGEGINTANEVVGYYENASNADVGFLYSAGTYSDIVPPGAIVSSALGINDSGVISGVFVDSSDVEHGFTYNGSTYTTFDVPGATFTYGWGINASGELTFSWGDANGFTEGALYNGSAYTTLDVPGALDTFAHAINTSGDIALAWYDYYANIHGAVLMNGSYYIFDDPNGTQTHGDGINDSGLIVGRYLPTGSTTNYDGFKGTL